MSEPKPHILVVDDDDRLRALLLRFLREQEFMVTVAADVAQARKQLEWFTFDLMILDVMMPGETGLQFLDSLKNDAPMPILMLSAMGESDDRIKGLEGGAEDYMAKPFEPKELVLRIRAILRRSAVQKGQSKKIVFGDYSFDLATSQLIRGAEHIALTSTELALLKALAEQAGSPVSREALSSCMPGISNERAVDVQVTRLRKKIEESEGRPKYLQTVRGAGYVLYATMSGGAA